MPLLRRTAATVKIKTEVIPAEEMRARAASKAVMAARTAKTRAAKARQAKTTRRKLPEEGTRLIKTRAGKTIKTRTRPIAAGKITRTTAGIMPPETLGAGISGAATEDLDMAATGTGEAVTTVITVTATTATGKFLKAPDYFLGLFC